jgi:hypothetical protein
MSGYTECPECHQMMLPVIEDGSIANAVMCQNQVCNNVVERDNAIKHSEVRKSN